MDNIIGAVKVFGGVIIVIVLLWFVNDYNNAVRDASESKAAAKKWQDNYNTAKDLQEAGEQEIERMRQDYSDLQEDLLEWRDKYQKAESSRKTAQTQIRKLETENEALRALLNTPIDCRVWLTLWPNSTKCSDPNQGSEAAKSQNPDRTDK